MNTRQAKKILCYPLNDPSKKPSAQTPYCDEQIVEAHRVYRRAFGRSDRQHFKWAVVRPHVYQALRART